MKPKPQMTCRVLPPKFRNSIDAEFTLRLTFKERLLILLGQNIKLNYHALSEHSPARMSHEMKHELLNEH